MVRDTGGADLAIRRALIDLLCQLGLVTVGVELLSGFSIEADDGNAQCRVIIIVAHRELARIEVWRCKTELDRRHAS